MLAIPSAASSIDFTSAPRRSPQRSIFSSSNTCRGSPYTAPMHPDAEYASA
jgi:hypothetical protein